MYLTTHEKPTENEHDGSTYFQCSDKSIHYIPAKKGRMLIFPGSSLVHGTVPCDEKRITLAVSCRLH